MKYVNSLKIMNGFLPAEPAMLSQKRVREMCEAVGRVNLGVRFICLPEGGAGYACATLLESVISAAGYRVGRITSAFDFSPRESVLVNGAIPSVAEFVKAANEIKRAAARLDTAPARQEAVFVLGLLLCKMQDCDYVILQGSSGEGYCLDSVCAPYDLIVLPTVYGSEDVTEQVKPMCEAVRRGTREVVSGNQRSEVYNMISNACAMVGVRLYIPMKAQLSVTALSARRLEFNYGGREGYLVKSPSYVMRDAAITVIESALAIRRGGVKMPWNSITAGLSAAIGGGCFEQISISPLIVCDSASTPEELELLMKTADEVTGECDELALCVACNDPEELERFLNVLEGRRLTSVTVVSEREVVPKNGVPVCCCSSVREAAERVLAWGECRCFCFGGVAFATALKREIVEILNR